MPHKLLMVTDCNASLLSNVLVLNIHANSKCVLWLVCLLIFCKEIKRVGYKRNVMVCV